jgi:hypothetical protein
MSDVALASQIKQPIVVALAVSNNDADDINSAATKNLRLNLFNGVIAKTPLC